MTIKCPRCGQECDGEAPNKPWFYHCECECGLEFCYDKYSSVYYDMDGNEIVADDAYAKAWSDMWGDDGNFPNRAR